jgi:transcriptional regulator with PAS, ATPase and Fis domain
MKRRSTQTMDVSKPAKAKIHQLLQIHPPVSPGVSPATVLLPRTVIGRSNEDGANLVLADPLVSRVHAELRFEGGSWVVTDLDSKNGIFVDGVRAAHAAMRDGSVLRLGKTLLVLREMGLEVPPPLPPGLPFRGNSPALRLVEETCRRIAGSDGTVLLRGETGTGKEVFARYLHACSGRLGRFVAVNCAAVSGGLFESAFFGHRKGAFTGAARDFGGYSRAAAGGTLFLDEVAEMPDESQAKLLRFLETGEIATIGTTDETSIDVRFIAATNQDLEARLASGRFRGDLFARLSRRIIVLPPLRHRPEDALAIAIDRLPPGHRGLSADAAEALAVHEWPFNVRELLAAIDVAIQDAPDNVMLPVTAFPEAVRHRIVQRTAPVSPAASPIPGSSDGMDSTVVAPDVPGAEPIPTREQFEGIFRDCDGNVSEIARRLGRDRRQVYRWMERFGLR